MFVQLIPKKEAERISILSGIHARSNSRELIVSGKVFSDEVFNLCGTIVEISDIKDLEPCLVSDLSYVRHELIEKEIFEDEYPEYFL